MAMFRQRGKSWQARIKRKGYPIQQKTFDTKAQAEKWARAIESEIDKGAFVSTKEAERTTLREVLERYEREILPSYKGWKQDLVRIRQWKRTAISDKFMTSIRKIDIVNYIDFRLKEVSKTTVVHELAVLNRIFKKAQLWEIAPPINPIEGLEQKPKLPKHDELRERRISDKEFAAVLMHSESVFLPDMAKIALETALRQAEIANMEWEHIDFRKRTLLVPEAKAGKRTISLTEEAIHILKNLPRRFDGKIWGITPHAISVAWRRSVVRARKAYEKECEEEKSPPLKNWLTNLRFHDLRHEATSRFFEQGLNPMQVSVITGHKTLEMLKRYTHLRPEDIAKVVKSNAGRGV